MCSERSCQQLSLTQKFNYCKLLCILLQLTFGLVKLSNVLPELGIGILICSCVPGGGLGHLIVVVTGNANTELSVAINFLEIFIPLGK